MLLIIIFMTSLVQPSSDLGPTKKPVTSPFSGSFTVLVYKTMKPPQSHLRLRLSILQHDYVLNSTNIKKKSSVSCRFTSH